MMRNIQNYSQSSKQGGFHPLLLTGRVEQWRINPLIMFPPPASSNAACAFNALRFPNGFLSKLIAYHVGATFLGDTLKSL